MTYCLYNLQHSSKFLKERDESEFDEFGYDINDESIWKNPNDKCGNPECPFIHNRKEFIKSIHEDPMNYILNLMTHSINNPSSNLSTKIYIPLKKETFNYEHPIICLSKYCQCEIAQKYSMPYRREESIEYIKCNTWYAFYMLSNLVNDIVQYHKDVVTQLIKLFWKLYITITGGTLHAKIEERIPCIKHMHIPSRCIETNCHKSHDLERLKKEMSYDIKLWTYVITRLIWYDVGHNLRTVNPPIPYKNEEIFKECEKFIRIYTTIYKDSLRKNAMFKNIIKLTIAFENKVGKMLEEY